MMKSSAFWTVFVVVVLVFFIGNGAAQVLSQDEEPLSLQVGGKEPRNIVVGVVEQDEQGQASSNDRQQQQPQQQSYLRRQLKANCPSFGNKKKCKKTGQCRWKNRKCVGKSASTNLTTACADIGKKKKCTKMAGCAWKNSKCKKSAGSTGGGSGGGGGSNDMATALNKALQSCPSSGAARTTCRAWLTAHNTRRWKYHQKYKKQPSLLKWNNSIASSAQSWANKMANQCMFQHSTADYGENLAAHSGVVKSNEEVAEFVMKRWWDNEEAEARAGDLKKILHFTQAAWYVTYQVGCAVSQGTCKNSSGKSYTQYYQVCQYEYWGNCNMGNLQNWEADVMKNPDGCWRSLP